jgi:hypothetical protein
MVFLLHSARASGKTCLQAIFPPFTEEESHTEVPLSVGFRPDADAVGESTQDGL